MEETQQKRHNLQFIIKPTVWAENDDIHHMSQIWQYHISHNMLPTLCKAPEEVL